MSGSVNKAIVVGNLGDKPEIRTMNGGGKVATFSVATSETWRDKNSGERKERTDWHRVVVFDEQMVEVCEKYLAKGMKVWVEGKMATRSYENKAGQKQYTTEIVVQSFRGSIQMLQGRGDRPGAPASPDDYGSQSGRDSSAAAKREEMSPGMRETLDDEIPF